MLFRNGEPQPRYFIKLLSISTIYNRDPYYCINKKQKTPHPSSRNLLFGKNRTQHTITWCLLILSGELVEGSVESWSTCCCNIPSNSCCLAINCFLIKVSGCSTGFLSSSFCSEKTALISCLTTEHSTG